MLDVFRSHIERFGASVVPSWLTLCLLACTTPGRLLAEQPAAEEPEAAPSRLLHQGLRDYSIQLELENPVPLVLSENAVLNWTNPARVGEEGTVFVWLHDGRPEVIGTAFTLRSKAGLTAKHSLMSLALSPLTASWQTRTVWSPKEPGISMHPLMESAKPAATESLRLVQLRAMARQFAVELVPPGKSPRGLRLVPQPLYRYQSINRGVLDGALFSFALGTDPEAILILEARIHNSNEAQWSYALARFHYWALRGKFASRSVWAVDRLKLEGKTMDDVFSDSLMRASSYISYRVPNPEDRDE